jgi:hypothetical protein
MNAFVRIFVIMTVIKAMVNITKAGPKELRGANMRSRKV